MKDLETRVSRISLTDPTAFAERVREAKDIVFSSHVNKGLNAAKNAAWYMLISGVDVDNKPYRNGRGITTTLPRDQDEAQHYVLEADLLVHGYKALQPFMEALHRQGTGFSVQRPEMDPEVATYFDTLLKPYRGIFKEVCDELKSSY